MSLRDPFRHHPRVLAQLPRLVRVYIVQCMIGFALSAIFTALVLINNVANIGHLVRAVEGGPLAVFVFFFLNGIVFSGVQFGIAIMRMGTDEDDRSGGPRIPELAEPQPVRVEAQSKRGPF